MKDMIDRKYERAFEQAASVHPIFATAAKEQMAQMVEVIARGNEHINKILATNQSSQVKGGFIAEEFHAETFNLDSVLKGDDARAYTDRDAQWTETVWKNGPLKKNDTPDIIVTRNGRVTTTAQSKYYDTPERTTQEMSMTKDGRPKYEDIDQLIGSDDQINPDGDVISIHEHAEAKSDALENTAGDPAEIQAYKQTAKKASGVLKDGESQSKPLNKAEADKIGSGDKTQLQEIEDSYQTKSTLKQMGNAAIGAAAMSAVVSGSLNTLRYIQLARDGKITTEEATIKIIGETVASAADSAVKASANAGVQSLIVRYGTKETALEILAKQGLKSMLICTASNF